MSVAVAVFSVSVWSRTLFSDVGVICVWLLITCAAARYLPGITLRTNTLGLWVSVARILLACVIFMIWMAHLFMVSPSSSSLSEMPTTTFYLPRIRSWWITAIVWIVSAQTAFETIWKLDRIPERDDEQQNDITSSSSKQHGENTKYDAGHLIAFGFVTLWVRRTMFILFFTYVYHPSNTTYFLPRILVLLHHVLLPLLLTAHHSVGVAPPWSVSLAPLNIPVTTALLAPQWRTSWWWRLLFQGATHITGFVWNLIILGLGLFSSTQHALTTIWPLLMYHGLHLLGVGGSILQFLNSRGVIDNVATGKAASLILDALEDDDSDNSINQGRSASLQVQNEKKKSSPPFLATPAASAAVDTSTRPVAGSFSSSSSLQHRGPGVLHYRSLGVHHQHQQYTSAPSDMNALPPTHSSPLIPSIALVRAGNIMGAPGIMRTMAPGDHISHRL